MKYVFYGATWFQTRVLVLIDVSSAAMSDISHRSISTPYLENVFSTLRVPDGPLGLVKFQILVGDCTNPRLECLPGHRS
jgi:hypothetical protein